MFALTPGVVKYIGRLHDDPLNATYIGVELDAPSEFKVATSKACRTCAVSNWCWHTLIIVGENDGTYRKQRYFDGRPYHGIFIKGSDIQCVTLRTVSCVLRVCMLSAWSMGPSSFMCVSCVMCSKLVAERTLSQGTLECCIGPT